MKSRNYLIRLDQILDSSEAGNKAISLYFLKRNKFRIPETYVIKSHAFSDYLKDRQSTLQRLKDELEFLPAMKFAIRSSTNLEDSEDYSYAGQFETYTDIGGMDSVLSAIEKVWNSASAALASEYHNHTRRDGFRCSVLVQEMIHSRLAGVCFSRNPVNNRNEIVIEAVEGPGEDLVQKGVTPFRWRIYKDNILEGPENKNHSQVISEVARDTKKLAVKYHKPVDVEWVFDGDNIYYLQMRGVTGKSDLPVYSNKMAQEMLPGQIKPLVWSVNIPLVNSTWIRILSEITGPLDVKPEELAKSFYFRTYFNIKGLGKIFKEFGLSVDSLEYLLTSDEKTRPSFKPGIRIFKHFFRIIRFIVTKLNFEKTFIKETEELREVYGSLSERINQDYSIKDSYKDLYGDLFSNGQKLAYLNIIIPLLMQIHNKRFIKSLKKKGIEYEKIDFIKDFPDLENYNPITFLKKIRWKVEALPPGSRSRIRSYQDFYDIDVSPGIRNDFDLFIKEFGHFSSSGNDFSYKKWQEEPEVIYNMIMELDMEESKAGKIGFSELLEGVSGSRKLWKQYRKAGKYRIYREQISSLYTRGYGLFRFLYLKLGDEMVHKGIIEGKEDILYLYRNEVDDIIEKLPIAQVDVDYYKKLIRDRKAEMERTRDYVLPAVIYGDDPPLLETENVKNYKGVGTSSGQFTGITMVIRNNMDFNKVQKDNVLVIPFSDVAWTPVLLKAGAVVSESGGMLSHCSIVAREMGIPALVSVENACAIGDGVLATVDGSNGILTIHDGHAIN